VVTSDAVSRYLTANGHRLPYVEPSTNLRGQDLLAEAFGQRFYPPGFRRREERVQDAIKRWFDDFALPFIKGPTTKVELEMVDGLSSIVNPTRDNAIKIMDHIASQISTNVYTAFLHDLYGEESTCIHSALLIFTRFVLPPQHNGWRNRFDTSPSPSFS
jgi:hypothetical protein